YQVLYHQAWRQTLASASASPWVVVQGGRPLGQHHELEGSLRIYRGNDGHINVATRLWRPHFGTATAPGSETAAAAQPASAAIQWPTLPLPPAPPRKALSAFFALDDGDEGLQPAQQSAPPPTQTLVDLDVLEHAQIINSRELHYLDHPRLGALVRVVPYQLPGDEAAGTTPDRCWMRVPRKQASRTCPPRGTSRGIEGRAARPSAHRAGGKRPEQRQEARRGRRHHPADLVEADQAIALARRRVHHHRQGGVGNTPLPRQSRLRHTRHADDIAAVPLQTHNLRRGLQPGALHHAVHGAIDQGQPGPPGGDQQALAQVPVIGMGEIHMGHRLIVPVAKTLGAAPAVVDQLVGQHQAARG